MKITSVYREELEGAADKKWQRTQTLLKCLASALKYLLCFKYLHEQDL